MKPIAAALGLLAALQSPSADDLAERLRSYLLSYEPKLSELIADESLRQQDLPSLNRESGEPFYNRTLKSEVAFIALPANAGWLGFRRVLRLDDRPVGDDTGSLREVLANGAQSDYAKAKEMLADSARYNLGERRTTNLPNLPLEMLHPRNAKRFSARIAGKAKIRGKNTTLLVFVEAVSPTIILATDGGDMRSIVKAWVETDNGRLWKAEVITRDTRDNAFPFDAIVAVDFKEHDTLGMLVPATMREEFFAGMRRRAWGEASYTNYRRFQTSARILPQ
jgi:hypothetical protein